MQTVKGSITGAAAVAQELGVNGTTLQAAAGVAFVNGMLIALIGALVASTTMPATKLGASQNVPAAA